MASLRRKIPPSITGVLIWLAVDRSTSCLPPKRSGSSQGPDRRVRKRRIDCCYIDPKSASARPKRGSDANSQVRPRKRKNRVL